MKHVPLFLLLTIVTSVAEVPTTISPASASTDPLGETLTFEVNAPDGTAWTATSTADWLTITSGATGTGPGTVTYTVSRNSSTDEREAQIQVTTEAEEEVDWANSTFEIVEGSFSWAEARADAEARGGRLAVLNTQEKIDAANAFLSSVGTWPILYIGLTDEAEEGVFRWVNGELLSVSNWAPTQPDDGGGIEDWVVIWESAAGTRGPGRWNDYFDDLQIGYLLELPLPTLEDGLVAYYPFNGNAEDESGNGLDLTTTPNFGTNRFGNAEASAAFDSAAPISSPDLTLGGNFSASLWVILDSAPDENGERAFMHGSWNAGGSMFSLSFGADGRGAISTQSGGQKEIFAPAGTFSLGQWHAISFTIVAWRS